MGKEERFKKIYEQYAKFIYNLSLNYLQNPEDAMEATQDVFVKIYKKIEGFNQKSSLKTWIYRVTVNHSLDVLKSKNRKARVFFSRQVEAHDSVEFNHPGVKVESKEELERIFEKINNLPEKQKTALLLKTIEGLSQKEIAEIMKLKEKAVESLLSRARANLMKNLKNGIH